MQPLVMMPDGVVRFRANPIVTDLLEEATRLGYSLNNIACREYSQADWEQFYQLIGYSLCGYHELSQVSDESAKDASAEARKLWSGVGGCRDDGCEWHCGVERET